MVSTIRYSANASSDHHPNQVPGILIIMNPKQPNLPTCSVTSTYLLFHLLSNPSLHLIANTTLGIIMTAIKISPKTLSHSILSTITNWNLSFSFMSVNKQWNKHNKPYHPCNQATGSLILNIYDYSYNERQRHNHHSFSICLTHSVFIIFFSFLFWLHIITRQKSGSFSFWFVKIYSK